MFDFLSGSHFGIEDTILKLKPLEDKLEVLFKVPGVSKIFLTNKCKVTKKTSEG